MINTQEELLEELLQEVQETRRYAEGLHQSSLNLIRRIDRLLETNEAGMFVERYVEVNGKIVVHNVVRVENRRL